MYKNNSRHSSEFKSCSQFQLSCYLTGKCNAVGYIFLYQTLWAIEKNGNLLKFE